MKIWFRCLAARGSVALLLGDIHMTNPQFITTAQGRRLAYHLSEGTGPGVVFLGGFHSDMGGTKAVYLEEWARAQCRAFLRFDYSGHGASSGTFTEGAIGDWAEDALAAIEALTVGPQVLVGSSMGGWISLLTCKALGKRIAGLVTVAAAPDFTEDSFWDGFSEDQKAQMQRDGRVVLPSDYEDPYIITKRLVEEGREQLVLRSPLHLDMPVRFLQGTADADVSVDVAMRLLNHADGGDMRLTLVKGADHRFSSLECLALIASAVEEVTATFKGEG